MRKLWRDIQAHKRAAVLFLVYWLATLLVTFVTWTQGIPGPVVLLLFTVPLIAGILVGLWRSSAPERAAHSRDRVWGGMLAGVLSAEISLLVMRGGIIEEFVGWVRGWAFFGQWGEVLGFVIVSGVLGTVLGLAGALLAMIPARVRRHGRPAPSS